MDVTVTVDPERAPVLAKLAGTFGVPEHAVASMLLRAALASPRAALNTIKACVAPPPPRKQTAEPEVGADEFARGWAGYAKAGGRMGSKALAVASWTALLAETKWTPAEAVRRWAVFVKLTPPQFLPDIHRLLRADNGYLTDESLNARAQRAKAEAGRAPGEAGAFDADTYEDRIARARAGSAPIPPTKKPPVLEPPKSATQEARP
jgi:hypothetical protein